ncbi:MAG: hypothetical protein AB7E47_17420 [Desulfovibrionaceae bacterium]
MTGSMVAAANMTSPATAGYAGTIAGLIAGIILTSTIYNNPISWVKYTYCRKAWQAIS